jgi:hypothetical protein
MTLMPFVVVGVRLVPEDLAELDAWRKTQPVEPSRSAAVRYLVKMQLENERIAARGR